jgi:7-carboxy-7-deazaguanine synthase
MSLRLLEHYASVQGEGPRTGQMTQFVRFAGCNLKCPKWPCDTPEAIDPKLYRKEQTFLQVRARPDRAERGVMDMCVLMAGETGARNICLTGGEPMLQPAAEIEDLVVSLVDNWDYHVEMFSNGTLPYTPAIMRNCTIVMDWKLPGSGDAETIGDRVNNYRAMGEDAHHSIKFTIADMDDLLIANDIYNDYDMANWPGDIWAGPVWGKFAPDRIVDWVKSGGLPWKLNLQTHKFVFGDKVRSV